MFYNHSAILESKNYVDKVDVYQKTTTEIVISLSGLFSTIRVQQLMHNCGIIYVGGLQDTVHIDKLPTMINLAKRAAQLGGYSAIYTTVVTKGNKKKIDILQQAGFKLIHSSGIKNTRSGNKIYLMVLEMK